MAYAVERRTREIGIRLALGARGGDVLMMILRRVLRLALPGIGLGLLAAAGLARVLSSLLVQVSPRDPSVFAAVALLLGAVTLIASWVPALRATRVAPLTALRTE